jgi:nicotinate-nucleotide pyrophosphorylase (carboxylating)
MSTTTQLGGLHRMTREQHVRAALYRGDSLTLANPLYLRAVRALTEELLREDVEFADLTVEALNLGRRRCAVEIRAKESGVAAGVDEVVWFYQWHGQTAAKGTPDGAKFAPDDVLIRAEGDAAGLLSLERVAVNLLQRMSGIATATCRLVEMARRAAPSAHVVGTRKTPLGLLDKRAVHVGGGGTHRLSLSDAILIKTNHLRLALDGTEKNWEETLTGAWEQRRAAAFFEVEVTTHEEALEVARIFASLQVASDTCPCMLLLDNFSVGDAARTVRSLEEERLHDAVLIEASGGISESSVSEYAAAGVDAISLGALTHSVRSLDLSAKLISVPESTKQ